MYVALAETTDIYAVRILSWWNDMGHARYRGQYLRCHEFHWVDVQNSPTRDEKQTKII